MAKHAKVIIAALVVLILSFLMMVSGEPMFGAAVLVLGMLGIAVLREKQEEEEALSQADGKSKLDHALGASTPELDQTPSVPMTGLPTWSPSTYEGEAPSTPHEPHFSAAPPATPRETPPVAPRADRTSSWDSWREFDGGEVTEEFDVENPLAALDRLDEIDPIAEVERLESIAGLAPTSAFSFSSAPSPINEAAVRTDDDIMAASQATELHVDGGQDSELARLLAKVQARLAAYE